MGDVTWEDRLFRTLFPLPAHWPRRWRRAWLLTIPVSGPALLAWWIIAAALFVAAFSLAFVVGAPVTLVVGTYFAIRDTVYDLWLREDRRG